MGSMALLVLGVGLRGTCRGASLSPSSLSNCFLISNPNYNNNYNTSFPNSPTLKIRSCSSKTTPTSLEPIDVSHLAETARISLTPYEVERFVPKIRQVIDWFGQLQGVDLDRIEPSIRADAENKLRADVPKTFEDRDSMISSVPSYEEPYIKVPRILNKE